MLKKSLLFIILVSFLSGCVNNQTESLEKKETKNETTQSFNFLPKEKTTYDYEIKNSKIVISEEFSFFDGDYVQTMEPSTETTMDVYKQDNTGLYKIEWYCNYEEGTNETKNILNQKDTFKDCNSFPLIKYPIKVGETWTDYQSTKYEILSINEKISTPIGEYDNGVKIKIHGEVNYHITYYVKDIGLVKTEIYDTETNELINAITLKSIN